MKCLLLTILILCVSGTQAQNGNDFISLDLLSPIYFKANDYNTTRYRFGYSHYISERWLIGTKIGYGAKSISFLPTQDEYRLLEVRPQVLWTMNSSRRNTPYLSGEFFYFNQKQKHINDFYLDQDFNYHKYDSAEYMRKQYGGIINIGMLSNQYGRFSSNVYAGLGLHSRVNVYENIVNRQEYDFEEHFPPYYRVEGKDFKANVQLGLDLLYNLSY